MTDSLFGYEVEFQVTATFPELSAGVRGLPHKLTANHAGDIRLELIDLSPAYRAIQQAKLTRLPALKPDRKQERIDKLERAILDHRNSRGSNPADVRLWKVVEP